MYTNTFCNAPSGAITAVSFGAVGPAACTHDTSAALRMDLNVGRAPSNVTRPAIVPIVAGLTRLVAAVVCAGGGAGFSLQPAMTSPRASKDVAERMWRMATRAVGER